MQKCKRGHLYTEKNTRWTNTKGKKYRSCRLCQSLLNNLRYHSDEEYRQKRIKNASEFYFRKKSDGLAKVP